MKTINEQTIFDYIKNNIDKNIEQIIEYKKKTDVIEVKYITQFAGDKEKNITININEMV